MSRRHHDIFSELSSGHHGGVWAGQDHSSWSVPWADLMMVMFVLFAVLYVFKSTNTDLKVLFQGDQGESGQQTAAAPDPLQGLIGRLAGHMNAVGDADSNVTIDGTENVYRSERSEVAVTRGMDNAVRIALRGHVIFPAAAEGLDETGRRYLDQVGDFLGKTPGTIHVVGFAAADEATGMDSFGLSMTRAQSVAAYLAQSSGIDPARFVISGRGAYEPEVPDSLDAAHRNRRVKLYILPGGMRSRTQDQSVTGQEPSGAVDTAKPADRSREMTR